MRILLDYRPALRERTGVGEYVHEAARALVATAPAGESLVLFSASWRDRVRPDAVPGAAMLDRRIPVRVLNFLWHRLEWPPIESLGAGVLDIAQSAHPLLIPASGAARVVTVHDLDYLDHPERTRREIRRDYPELTASHARRADQVLAVSRFTAGQVESRLGVPRDRISICSPAGPDWPMRASEPATGGVILFLGALDPRKNVGALADAYEQLLARRQNVPALVLAGPLPPESSALAARLARPPFAGHVELPGYVSSAAKLALFDRALVFVLPSHHEGFGITAVEAMARGVPVIASNRGALPEVTGGAARLVDPDDPAALAVALEDVLDHADLRHRMRDEGRRAAQRYTWTATAHAMRDAWALALEHRKARRG